MPNYYTSVLSGEVQGGTTAAQLPDIPCSRVKLKALGSNSGNVYIGGSGVTVPGAASNTTAGFELDAGQDTDWLEISNLNMLYMITDNNGDDVSYLALL